MMKWILMLVVAFAWIAPATAQTEKEMEYESALNLVKVGHTIVASIGVPAESGDTSLTKAPAEIQPGRYICYRDHEGKAVMSKILAPAKLKYAVLPNVQAAFGIAPGTCPGGNCQPGTYTAFPNLRPQTGTPIYSPFSRFQLPKSTCPGGNCPNR